MKKTMLIGLAALTMLAGCNRDEVIEMNQENAISFENAFVDASTKATDVDMTNLNKFYVHAMFKGENNNYSQPFVNTEVAKQANGKWTYEPAKYWFKGEYDFKAVNIKNEDSNSKFLFTAGVNDAFAAESTITFDNSQASGYNGEQDLIYATAHRDITNPTNVEQTKAVPFTFSHLLAKVKFTITNGMGEGYTIDVKNLKITDAVSNGTITVDNVNGNAWATGDTSFGLAFNEMSIAGQVSSNSIASNEKYIIPKTGYEVSFTVDVKDGSTVVNTKTFTVNSADQVFQMGYSYNFTTEIKGENFGANPITFTVEEIKGFTDSEIKLQ